MIGPKWVRREKGSYDYVLDGEVLATVEGDSTGWDWTIEFGKRDFFTNNAGSTYRLLDAQIAVERTVQLRKARP